MVHYSVTRIAEKSNGTQKGMALLVVLWVMAILTIMVLSLSLLTRSNTFGAFVFKKGLEEQFLAEAGIERGITEMAYYLVNASQVPMFEDKKSWKFDGTLHSGRLANGVYEIRIQDESGKIALNGLSDASGIVLKNLLLRLKSTPEEADTIVDSILDWKDPDDLHRLNGAENDYYQSLTKPYPCKDGTFESLEELLLVKGITPEILYGTGERKGLIQFLTLHNRFNRINLNVAPRELLAALPGVSDVMADNIVDFRLSTEIKRISDITGIVGNALTMITPYASGQPGPPVVCMIETKGYRTSERQGYTIQSTVKMDNPEKFQYVYYKSPAGNL
ncbi:MAG: general secretion pathway protein GspK [Syntrophaceae bacterium]|nr:general secretion pathway protein GspK [Syntrophaceae bacterium]